MSTSPAPSPPLQRLDSLDAYRGFVMLLMMAEVLRLRQVALALPESKLWEFLSFHQTHVAWSGCSLHDLIQPSFSFLVGVALPFSILSRQAKGQSFTRMLLHAIWRAVLLTFLGVFLRSAGLPHTNFTFIDTLSQIGMGYVFLFLLGFVKVRWQVLAAAVIVVGYWGAFALYPVPGEDFDYAAVGVGADWKHHYTGFAAHWNKNSNLGWKVDTWFLNLFPRVDGKPYTHMDGYATLNFIPTLATMILGLLAGGWLRLETTKPRKLLYLVLAGGASLGAGWALDHFGICPSVKRIWTPAWVLFSGGWCFFLLAGFYALADGLGWRALFYPLIVIGANSIAAYCMAHWWSESIARGFQTHLALWLGVDCFKLAGEAYEPLVRGSAILLVYWLILLWMYRRRIFVRI
ncbi:MAG: acyltransferase family protein [Planctomycetales bacterium]